MRRSLFFFSVALFASLFGHGAQTFTVASYNVENYIDLSGSRPAKPPESKAKIREILRSLNADVIALQEMGRTHALLELRDSLRADGLDYPFWEHATGFDTNIFVAVLSRFPIVSRRSHTNESFLLQGRRFRMSRAIIEIDVQVNPFYQFTLFAAHLKSRRPSPDADQEEWRQEEALILREKFQQRLKNDPKANVVVVGDLNDVKNSKAVRAVLGRKNSPLGLLDTRPAERNGDFHGHPQDRYAARAVTWTHYYAAEDSYSRIDYILLNRGMAREWQPDGTYILTAPDWGRASDHRPIIATFVAQDR